MGTLFSAAYVNAQRCITFFFVVDWCLAVVFLPMLSQHSVIPGCLLTEMQTKAPNTTIKESHDSRLDLVTARYPSQQLDNVGREPLLPGLYLVL